MSAGWVKLHRSAESHPVLRNATRRGLFDRLLLRAAREAGRVSWRGNTLALDVGQLAISVREFAEANELTYKETRLHLQRLEAEGMISLAPILGARKGAGKGAIGSLVTICNFSKFQLSENSRGAIEGAVDGAIGAQWGRTEQEVGESKNLNLDKTESLTTPTPPADAGREARAVLWAEMKGFLGGPNPGGVIGRWVRDYAEGSVLEVYFAARREHPADPLTWMAGALARRKKRAACARGDDALLAELNEIERATRAEMEEAARVTQH